MTRFLKFGLGLIFDRLGWKLLSLGAAFAIWAMVASEPELSTFISTPVEYKNLADNLEIASNPVTAVLLELRGPSGELQELGDPGMHPQIILDMSSAAPGERTYVIGDGALKRDGAVRLPPGVRLMSALPSQVRFTFEPRATRLVPVATRFVENGVHGYFVSSQTVTPDKVEIVGPASHVAAVKQADTDAIDVSGSVGTTNFRVNAFTGDPFVRIQSSPQIDVTVTMKKK